MTTGGGSHAAPVDAGRLLSDPAFLRAQLLADLPAAATALREARYPLVPESFVRTYLEHLRDEHLENPLAARYVEAELGAPARQAQILAWLAADGHDVRGRRCLDIGCNNGALSLACAGAGARAVLGVDVAGDRLASARRLCAGCAVEFLQADVLTEAIPGPFDAILCTDVIEHVPDPAALLARIGTLLDPAPGSFACVTLHNALHPDSVLSEPHYDVPGLVLLPRERAAALWARIRERYRSRVDYEVREWHGYASYAKMARRAGLGVRPLGGPGLASEAEGQMRGFREHFARIAEQATIRLREAPLAEEEREELAEAIRRWIDGALRAHQRTFAARRPSPERLQALFLAYHYHPLVMVMERSRERGRLARLLRRG